MRRSLSILIVTVLVVGVSTIAAGWYLDWWHRAVEEVPSLHGRSLNAVVGELGPPTHQSEFTMDTASGDEMRLVLRDTYPLEDPRSAKVLIKEMQWDYHTYHLNVWFHEVDGGWVALRTCRWKNGVVF